VEHSLHTAVVMLVETDLVETLVALAAAVAAVAV
tara:strand:- start:3 stop:104 length:102 start_codon:yes stop_codon:yes gene_type:complete